MCSRCHGSFRTLPALAAEALHGIKVHGYVVQCVVSDIDDPVQEPDLCYTIGLTAHGWPELITDGMSVLTAAPMLNDIARTWIDAGECQPTGAVLQVHQGDGLDPLVVVLWELPNPREVLLVARAIYQDMAPSPLPLRALAVSEMPSLR